MSKGHNGRLMVVMNEADGTERDHPVSGLSGLLPMRPLALARSASGNRLVSLGP